MNSGGCLVQPLRPAKASEAPASFKKLRRETGSTHSEAWRGNSRSSRSPKACSSASSSRVRQYFGPLTPASFFRTESRSRLAGLISVAESSFRFKSFSLGIRFQTLGSSLLAASTVASGATCNIPGCAKMVFLRQYRAQLCLGQKRVSIPLHSILLGAVGRLIGHIEHFLFGPQELFRLAMAVQAPLHLQGILLVHERHLVDRSMTTGAANAFVYMDAVIEIHEVRQIVDPCPLQRLARAEAGANRLQQGGICPYLGMTIHAGFSWWDPSETRLFDRGMTITAVQPQPSHMMLMAERDRLVGHDTLIGNVRRALQLHQRRSYRSKKQNDS